MHASRADPHSLPDCGQLHGGQGSSQSEEQHSSPGDLFTAFHLKDSQLHYKRIANLPEKNVATFLLLLSRQFPRR